MWRDATEMAMAVNKRKVAPYELVEEAIERIEHENPKCNAVVSKQYEEALERAKTVNFLEKPFAGVPILLKDLGQSQEGQPATSGSRLFSKFHSSHTDAYVQRIEELGFIVLGRTNTPEFGFKNISDSQLHGVVSLPLDKRRNAGGSSGGAAAAVASGMAPLAGASDGGGSIRIPASFNGLIGLKPSRGRLPVGPFSYRGWQGASSHFALTKSVRDTKRLLYGMQACQLESPFPLPLLSKESIFSEEKRVFNIAFTTESPIETPVSQDAKQAVLNLVSVLESMGHQVEELTEQPLNGIEAMRSYYLMNSVETAQMFDGIEASLGRKMALEDMELMTWAIFRSGQTIPGKLYSKTLQDWDTYSAIMARFHETYDILLTPTVAEVAPFHDEFVLSQALKKKLIQMDQYGMKIQQELIWEMFEKSLAWTPFTQQANLTGQPSISLPTYQTKEGLPIGCQLTAAKGCEDGLLHLAQSLENTGCLKVQSM